MIVKEIIIIISLLIATKKFYFLFLFLFFIPLCICKTDIITNNILFEFDLKVDKVIVYPSDIFKIRL